MKRIIYILLISIFCSSCATIYSPSISISDLPDINPQKTVFIENPELKFEYKVLKYSGLYQFSPDPYSNLHVRLLPIQRGARPGELDILLTFLTFGIIPSYSMTGIYYKYLIIEGDKATEMEYFLSGTYQTSLWSNFKENYVEDEKTYGLMLRAQAIEQTIQNK